jgi:hypothetical protein
MLDVLCYICNGPLRAIIIGVLSGTLLINVIFLASHVFQSNVLNNLDIVNQRLCLIKRHMTITLVCCGTLGFLFLS